MGEAKRRKQLDPNYGKRSNSIYPQINTIKQDKEMADLTKNGTELLGDPLIICFCAFADSIFDMIPDCVVEEYSKLFQLSDSDIACDYQMVMWFDQCNLDVIKAIAKQINPDNWVVTYRYLIEQLLFEWSHNYILAEFYDEEIEIKNPKITVITRELFRESKLKLIKQAIKLGLINIEDEKKEIVWQLLTKC